MNETPEPCPFCGSKGLTVQSLATLTPGRMDYAIGCTCGAHLGWSASTDGAIDRWNTRATIGDLKDVIERQEAWLLNLPGMLRDLHRLSFDQDHTTGNRLGPGLQEAARLIENADIVVPIADQKSTND